MDHRSEEPPRERRERSDRRLKIDAEYSGKERRRVERRSRH